MKKLYALFFLGFSLVCASMHAGMIKVKPQLATGAAGEEHEFTEDEIKAMYKSLLLERASDLLVGVADVTTEELKSGYVDRNVLFLTIMELNQVKKMIAAINDGKSQEEVFGTLSDEEKEAVDVSLRDDAEEAEIAYAYCSYAVTKKAMRKIDIDIQVLKEIMGQAEDRESLLDGIITDKRTALFRNDGLLVSALALVIQGINVLA